jgi:S-adenosylmethionine hydrolase
MAIIDPGVGTDRKAILIETNHYFFIGPDNGLFSFLKKSEISRIILLQNPDYFFLGASSTFHARDYFRPGGWIPLSGHRTRSIRAGIRSDNKNSSPRVP